VGTPESDLQVPEKRVLRSVNKRLLPPWPRIDGRPSDSSSGSAGPTSHARTRALKRKVSRGPGIPALSTPGRKRVRVDRIGDGEGGSFRCDEKEIMEAGRATRTSTYRKRGMEVETYPSGLDRGRILDGIRALEEKARDIVGEISALKTYIHSEPE
jgi:hypothetical protein